MKSAVTSKTLKTRYIGIDIFTGDWVGGDNYVICNFNDAVYLCKMNVPKSGNMARVRKKHKEEYIILPESLHEATGLLTPDGKIDYQSVNLSWYNWKQPLRKFDFKESDSNGD